MSNELEKKAPTALDEYEGYTDEMEGDADRDDRRVIQGTRILFRNEGNWETREGEELTGKQLACANVRRSVVKWSTKPGKPPETRFLEPNEKYPEIKALNENTPREEWVPDFNDQMRGPYEAQRVVYLVDLADMGKYTYVTGTTGGILAVSELVDKVTWMRRLRGSRVYPVIELASKHMATKFGGRERPHLPVKRWVQLGDSGGGNLVEAPDAPTLPPMKMVEEPSLKEELKDAVPW